VISKLAVLFYYFLLESNVASISSLFPFRILVQVTCVRVMCTSHSWSLDGHDACVHMVEPNLVLACVHINKRPGSAFKEAD
jgi:hypothetical protein